MAKKTFVVEVNTAAKKQAFVALLTVLGFEKIGPDSFAEPESSSVNSSKTPKIKQSASVKLAGADPGKIKGI